MRNKLLTLIAVLAFVTPALAEKVYEKVDDNTMKESEVITETKEATYNLTNLELEKADLERIIAGYQVALDRINALIQKAKDLGVVKPEVTAVIE